MKPACTITDLAEVLHALQLSEVEIWHLTALTDFMLTLFKALC
jgi:hypothetical protein